MSEATMTASLPSLPSELLLEIIDHLEFLPRYRRRELVALTTVCKRLNAITTDLLHSELCVSIYGLAEVLEVYVAKPDLATKVKSLELFYEQGPGGSVHEKRRRTKGIEIKQHALKSSASRIRKLDLSKDAKQELREDLKHNDHTAVFALALTMLPNMQQLLLGTFISEKDDIGRIFEVRQNIAQTTPLKRYLEEIFTAFAPKLRVLQVPHKWPRMGSGIPSGISNSVFNGHCQHGAPANLATCTNLKELNISVLAFVGYERHLMNYNTLIWLYATLPASLQKLTLAHPNLTQAMFLFENIVEKKEAGLLPRLALFEVYMDSRDPERNNEIFDTELSKEEESNLASRLNTFVKRLSGLGVATTLHWCHYGSIFWPITNLISESRYSGDQLRVVETRGYLDYLRPEAERLGRRWKEEELERREERHKERRDRGEASDTSEEEFCCWAPYD